MSLVAFAWKCSICRHGFLLGADDIPGWNQLCGRRVIRLFDILQSLPLARSISSWICILWSLCHKGIPTSVICVDGAVRCGYTWCTNSSRCIDVTSCDCGCCIRDIVRQARARTRSFRLHSLRLRGDIIAFLIVQDLIFTKMYNSDSFSFWFCWWHWLECCYDTACMW